MENNSPSVENWQKLYHAATDFAAITPTPPTPEPTLKYCDDTIPVYQQSGCKPKPEEQKQAGSPPPECSSDYVPGYQKRSLGCPGY